MRSNVVVFCFALAGVAACGPETPPAAPVQASAATTTTEATPAAAPVGSAAPIASAVPSASPAPSASAAPSAPTAAEPIRVVAPDQRELSEAGRTMAVDELERATDAARKEAKGGPLRVFGVAAGGTLAKLGLENGDRLVSLDDRTLGAEPDARGAFTAARKATSMTLKIERKGKPLMLRYAVK
jgi:type II secretory pathway component PulC